MDDPSGVLPPAREEFPTEVDDELEAIKKEMSDLRHQLEFIPSGHKEHSKPVDKFGYAIQWTTRPPYHPPEDWKALEVGRRRTAAATYLEEKGLFAAKRDGAAVLHAILEGYCEREGYAAPVLPHRDNADTGSRGGGSLHAGQTCAETITQGKKCTTRDEQGEPCCMSSMVDIAMLVTHATQDQREKSPEIDPPESFYECTARDVGTAERLARPQAKAALKKQWDCLRACGTRGCWDEDNPWESGKCRRNAGITRRLLMSVVSWAFVWRRTFTFPKARRDGSSRVGLLTRETRSRTKRAIGRFSRNSNPAHPRWPGPRSPTSTRCWKAARANRQTPKWHTHKPCSRDLKLGLSCLQSYGPRNGARSVSGYTVNPSAVCCMRCTATLTPGGFGRDTAMLT